MKPREWQARIVAEPRPGLFLILIYGWGMGEPYCFKLLTLDQLTSAELDCSFYQRYDAWRDGSEEIIRFVNDRARAEWDAQEANE